MCIFKRKVFGKMSRVLISKKKKKKKKFVPNPDAPKKGRRGGGEEGRRGVSKNREKRMERRGGGLGGLGGESFLREDPPPKVRLRPTLRIIFFFFEFVYIYISSFGGVRRGGGCFIGRKCIDARLGLIRASSSFIILLSEGGEREEREREREREREHKPDIKPSISHDYPVTTSVEFCWGPFFEKMRMYVR